MKKILIALSLLVIVFPFSIRSQNITVIKKSPHLYVNDSLACLDRAAATRIMYERTERENTIAAQTETIQILDSAAYTCAVRYDSLQHKNNDLNNALVLSENTRVVQVEKAKAQAKPYKILTYVGFGLLALIGIIKL